MGLETLSRRDKAKLKWWYKQASMSVRRYPRQLGSVCAAVAALLLVVVGVVIWILIKKHRQKEKEQQDISEPWSPIR